ncbi:MAG TPA: arabinofuranosidase catalytic domain-containing protein [Streptosporangiaceae bacterium]
MATGFTAAGLAAPVAAGNVGNVPTGTVVTAGSGDCMDAYLAGGTPNVGQIAAINACAVTADQNWTEWSNGMMTNGGLCMDDNGDSNPADNAVVNLQACNGGYTQLWYENGAGEIVNGATGSCLDDPGTNTAPGTQLIVFPCKGGANQQWAPPGGTDAVTGYGNMLSVQTAGSYQLCVMPQTTLANPVGSNVLTNYYQSIGSGCGYPRLWAVGSNGTLMANGTNALCMDSNGPATTGPGGEAAYFVQLERCDGAQSQVWKVVSTYLGPTLQNAGDGLCLNTPSGSLGTTVSMIVASCASLPYPGELWTLPGFAASRSLLSGGPCDIYLYYGTPCGAAYSMDRAMYSGYDGPLYQVTRASDGTKENIGLLATGGDVNASEQDSFCASTSCTVTEIYDQSSEGNNLTIEQGGGAASAPDQGADADALKIKIGGNEAYGLDIEQGTGYRDDTTNGIATGSAPEGMYMVASGTHANYGCCFDFGNVETDNHDHGAGTMDAVNLTTWCGNNNSFPCSGGPWVEADLENGQWTGSGPNTESASNSDFVTAMLSNNGQNTSNGQNSFELQGGNSESGGLTSFYNGALPSGYSPMSKQGAIVLGTGGDNSNSDVGSFFEGVMTAGYPSDAADAAVQANIVAAGYSGSTNPTSTATAGSSAAGQAVVHAAGATGAAASGFSSVYTVDSANQHLQETYLPYMGDAWTTQDLSATGGTLPGTPPVMPGTQPVALVHCGYTSVFTVDAASGDLQETYLPAIGDAWLTQDLSANYNTPPTNQTPTAVMHSAGAAGGTAACGYTSVYTRDRNGDLQETYLPNAGFPGDSWHTQDLSGTGGTLAGTPSILAGTSPVAIVHCGFTSVYTVDGNHNLQETYLPAIGGAWLTQDLSGTGGTLPGTPDTTTTPTAVVHTAGAAGASPGCGYTSVYTVDEGTQDLQETYLPDAGFPGDSWQTQDLSAKYHTPAVAPGTQPEALVHLGYTSVYTVDQGTDQVQETYLAAIGGGWLTQSLSANYHTPTTNQSPIVLLHPDAGGVLDWVSVFTVDEFTAHLQETYLSNVGFPGDSWVSQDLSSTGGTMPGTPPAYVPQSSQASWSVAHDGYTSVYTGNTSGDLEETYLSAMGKSWVTQNLSGTGGTLPGTPTMLSGTSPVAVAHDGYTSVYTIDAGDSSHAKGDLQETYLKALGGPWYTQDLSQEVSTPASKVTPTAVFHDGYVSVYTVDASNGNLWETYLPSAGFPGDAWHAQNLSANYHTPPVDAYTSPVAIVHDGYTSVYTVDATNAADGSTLGDLQETYLPYMGAAWSTQNLSTGYHVPLVNILTSPTAVFHDGYTSVYTVDSASSSNPELPGDLQETYLPAMGDAWSTQDLTANYHTPQVAYGVQPVALYHTGYTSVYTVDGGNGGTKIGDLQETYLPAMSDSWSTQDLSVKYPAIATVAPGPFPSALVHYDTSGGLTWTSVFTIDDANGDVRENYLPAMGDSWSTQDLIAPPV